MKKIIVCVILFAYILSVICCGNDVHTTTNIACKDALGRTLPAITDYEDNKYVGVFYWLWHQGGPNSKDTTKLLKSNPKEFWDPFDKTGIAPPGGLYYFNEPLYGYYNSEDEWVMRKHIEMFIYAGVDFLCFDYTNPGEVFEDALMKFLSVLDSYHKQGWKTPKIMFMTNTGSDTITQWLYMAIYKKNLYKEHWFYGPYDKPLIVVGGEDLSNGLIKDQILDFFHIRPAQWPGFEYPYYEDGFSWCDLNRPPKIHEDLINVSVAQHRAYVFSYGMKIDPLTKTDQVNYGRGYTTKNKKNGDVNDILSGANIQENWDYAISKSPEIVFVTGWNEWATNKRVPSIKEQTVACFVDSFNTEFSRDMEMTKNPTYVVDDETGEYIMEGYGDNYYLQLIQNVRKYKGVMNNDDVTIPVSKSIDFSQSVTQWEEINSTYENPSYDNVERKIYYKIPASENYIKTIKVTHDDANVYFYIETDKDITKNTDGKTNHMNLFIGVEGLDSPAWESYQYVLNRKPVSDTKTSFEVCKGGYEFEKTDDVDYIISGNTMQIKVPFTDLKIEDDTFTIYFKCADGVMKENDIMDYYVTGESLPIGRLSYIYKSNKAAWSDTPKQDNSLPTGLIITIVLASLVVTVMIGMVIVVFSRSRKEKK